MITDPLISLFILAIPIACISWIVTFEEIFREPREYFVKKNKEAKWLLSRKFFFIFTCEFCFSVYVTFLILFITKYTLIYSDWRGYLVSYFSLIWVANMYMSVYRRLRLGIKSETVGIQEKEEIKEIRQGKTKQKIEQLIEYSSQLNKEIAIRERMQERLIKKIENLNEGNKKEEAAE